jgi:hypothetical protein
MNQSSKLVTLTLQFHFPCQLISRRCFFLVAPPLKKKFDTVTGFVNTCKINIVFMFVILHVQMLVLNMFQPIRQELTIGDEWKSWVYVVIMTEHIEIGKKI